VLTKNSGLRQRVGYDKTHRATVSADSFTGVDRTILTIIKFITMRNLYISPKKRGKSGKSRRWKERFFVAELGALFLVRSEDRTKWGLTGS
jgi:hypothetical protein